MFAWSIAAVAGERLGNGVLAVGVLRAIQAAPRQQAGEVRNPNAEHLLCQDVVYAIYQVLTSSATTTAKIVWALVILFLPVLGLIAWFIAGPKASNV